MTATKEELMTSLTKMTSKMDDPKYQKRFADFNKTMQFNFTDVEEASCHLIFQAGTAEIKEGTAENPDMTITTTTETIMGIMSGKISPTRAFMGGKLKAKGPMNDMLKLQALMK
ncbi:MAG: SCP2 sterol-binding domain-containing protein [Candidatus Hodarchaeales archaeon]|jgi:putative sterol carrier protein